MNKKYIKKKKDFSIACYIKNIASVAIIANLRRDLSYNGLSTSPTKSYI